MADLVYDYAKISALVGDWQASIARLQQLLDEQRAEVNKLAESWTGATGDAFRREQKIWQQTADTLLAAAKKLGGLISAAAEAMAKTEAGVANNPQFSGSD
ncbi:WXG100 family type VII secretion target [Mycobacteroides abscessus]|uniref:ESAT-6-like protein n=4 Tax=Mycobacteroides abscessus TaxID=36809 RepID=B1MAY6_MYCA9|nr:WXG100 family type VII secretion target [Mycobacteroides abscessus]EUA60889.1 WXG100 type VII secretion target family protein [Mycobacteroides abscessus 1948]AKP58202.1 hypothetical protein MAUC22_11570 [Mycobacteroides abscessus UC22]ALM16625.1 hypothetical protein AOY11_10520 [Mycobacteroides abscessus]AMU45823.1 hypothetical protein A3O00_11685 [Mycobacteroides abscessus]AMU50708.1 hypothetical protein A3O01_11560 [Mycobacteroides abscessus]